ncbi:MAG TPA: 50S ribosomal protein L9 [bacterium]|nr:50S ribosomal protein L9 [bacterium]
MKVILLKDVAALGHAGDVREVKDGHARNYLLPRGLAAPATDASLRALEQTKAAAGRREARLGEELHALKDKLEALVVEVRARAGEDGKLFGSVTAQDVADAIQRQGIDVSKKQIELGEAIKNTGFYKVPVRLHPKATAKVEVNVIAAG